MGYTHYWDLKDTDKKTFEVASNLLKKVLKDEPIVEEYDKPKTKPVLNKDEIRFNGKDNDGHETFYIPFSASDKWNFCKTACKPYDRAVTASLIILEHYGIVKEFSSDGDRADWREGIALVEKHTDIDAKSIVESNLPER